MGRFRTQSAQFHFDAQSYLDEVSSSVPHYREMQTALARSTGSGEIGSFLDLGIGTGETAAAVLDVHPTAHVTGVDVSADMLAEARKRLPAARVETFILGRLEDFVPATRFDLVVSSLAVHHLTARQKRRLFDRIHTSLPRGGRFVDG